MTRAYRHIAKSAKGILILFLVLGLAACATRPPESEPAARQAYDEANDKLEPFNRAMFAVNGVIQDFVLMPVGTIYTTVLPDPMEKGIRNALRNLGSPIVFMNDTLQGEGKRAKTTFLRFIINSTLGIAGLFDVAKSWGLERHEEDFGQTLAVWGMGEGTYLVLPVFGPSSARDAVGLGVDALADPVGWILRAEDLEEVGYILAGVEGVDLFNQSRDALEEMERTSVDFYAALREKWRTNREDAIRNGVEDDIVLPDYYFEEESDEGDQDE